jgi:uncharacterized phiE125 gp8 family phage protein
MAYFRVETAVTAEPITLAEVKRHLRIYDDGYNDSQSETITTQTATPSVITGSQVDILGCEATVWVNAGVFGSGAKLDVVIYESDTSGSGFTAWSGGTFTQMSAAGQASKLYTGGKRYIKAVATVTVANVTFGVNVQTLAGDPVSDAELQNFITRAREEAEELTRLSFAPQTLEMGLDEFPNANFINLKRPPLVSVTSFDVYDEDGTKITQTPTTHYLVDTYSTPGRIVLPYGASWSNDAEYPVNPIRIKYVAGYTSLPARLKTALLLHIGLLTKYRDIPIPKAEREGLDRIYRSYRTAWFGGEQE